MSLSAHRLRGCQSRLEHPFSIPIPTPPPLRWFSLGLTASTFSHCLVFHLCLLLFCLVSVVQFVISCFLLTTPFIYFGPVGRVHSLRVSPLPRPPTPSCPCPSPNTLMRFTIVIVTVQPLHSPFLAFNFPFSRFWLLRLLCPPPLIHLCAIDAEP